MPGAAAMQAVGAEQGERQREQPRDLPSAQGVLAEYLEHIGKQGNARAEQNQADDIQGIVLACDVIRQVPIHQYQPGKPDRNVDEENDAPMKVVDDDPAE